MRSSVALLYRSRAPSHYVARLGSGGWCEGWGWTANDALTDLAGVVIDVRSPEVPDAALVDVNAAALWLRRRTDLPVLDNS
jgi:hypothetical protein